MIISLMKATSSVQGSAWAAAGTPRATVSSTSPVRAHVVQRADDRLLAADDRQPAESGRCHVVAPAFQVDAVRQDVVGVDRGFVHQRVERDHHPHIRQRLDKTGSGGQVEGGIRAVHQQHLDLTGFHALDERRRVGEGRGWRRGERCVGQGRGDRHTARLADRARDQVQGLDGGDGLSGVVRTGGALPGMASG